ncbi:hypothetical protein AK812_SmicGene42128 [Symbiodinium microadriaticum]|uniref:Uncharacterized protein n=1 Tax=Symbiodinium microadriaticum TaxID=2951 RepID=A0A1Q9C4E6_SYMMI|nr:hypothetical protein AK812_SmicGene42128 [Symbiodinium microadriaticum]
MVGCSRSSEAEAETQLISASKRSRPNDEWRARLPNARARGCHLSLQLLLPVLSFLVVGTVVAFCFKLATGYPYFLTGPVHGKEER